jgi:transposase InsO family protein
VKFRFIEQERVAFPVTKLCEMLSVSPAGFYASRRRPPSARATTDAELVALIKRLFRENRRVYGSPRIRRELRALGHEVGRRRVARLMRENGLFAKRRRRFKKTTDSSHALPVAPNVLERHFETDAPNKVWVTDITYVWTREGWLYLAAILDLYSRAVVGWAMSESLSRELALRALDMALRARHPKPGLVHHSDRGCQYASDDYRRALAAKGIVCSMSRKGDCWDNAVAESFFATLKTELVNEADFTTRAEARSAIFDFIEVFYNRRRRHSSLGYLCPVDFEKLNYEIREKAA